MNRNVLKIIALVSMIIDHIGCVFFPNIVVLRVFGRLAFPIFAFFVSEGYFYTRNKKKYALTLFIFALISWTPFNLALSLPMYTLNVIAVFLLSILGMFIVDKIKENNAFRFTYISILCLFTITVFVFDCFGFIPEGIFGVYLPIIFYVFRDKKWLRLVFGAIILIAMSSLNLISGLSFRHFVQFFSLLALIPIAFYNGKKGKWNLKYLFYITYPTHFLLFYIITLFI